MRSVALGLVLSVLAAAPARAAEVTETGPDGAVVLRYATDENGNRHGGCVEFHANGKVRVRSQYRNGLLHGPYQTYDADGRRAVTTSYREGRLHGSYVERDAKGEPVVVTEYVDGRKHGAFDVFADGRPVSSQRWVDGVPVDVDGLAPYPRDREQIRAAVESVFNARDPLESVPGDPQAPDRGESLRLLKVFRYLCGLPYEDLVLDETMNRHAVAGAALCERIGRLDHTPQNPGMPEADYQFAFVGTSRSNLYMGGGLVDSVPAYMDDSDPSNIDRVGHRRWCLNPRMLKVGFGASGKFSAMMAHDASRKDAPDFDVIAYPPAGFVPTYYFGARHAWSLSLNPRRYDTPDARNLRITIRPVDDDWVRRRPALDLDHKGVSSEGMGVRDCVIFRPKDLVVEDGRIYWVEVEGLTKNGRPAPLRYVVHFFEL